MTDLPVPLWRERLRASNLRFTDAMKQAYLDTLEKTGRKNLACKAAGVSGPLAKRHADNDPEFAAAIADALDSYADTVHLAVQHRAIDGVESLIFQHGKLMMRPLLDEDGAPVRDDSGEIVMVPATELKYSDQLLKLEAQRVDKGFVPTHKSEVEHTHKGGIMIAPAEMTPQQWMEAEKNRMIDEAKAAAEDALTLDLPALETVDMETQ